VGSPPALDRRRIAAPRAQDKACGKVRLAHWSMVRLTWVERDRCLRWVNSGLQPTPDLGPLIPR